MNGIINLYKETGYTSFDAVAKLRKILKEKKIGHTGTLDPGAEGVLPICIGKATKLCPFLTDSTKTYEVILLLGIKTDTLDMEGEILETHPVDCPEEKVRECVKSFLGERKQMPPMYSALKVGGKRLYEFARTGVTVERSPRQVFFYELNIVEIKLPRVKIKVTCSKGTYVRTLCSDIGEALGCGGCMEALVRTRSGMFSAENALTLSKIEKLARDGKIEEALIPMEKILEEYPAVFLTRIFDKIAYNGGKISATECGLPRIDEDSLVRMYDSKKNLIGLYSYSIKDKVLYPKRILL